MIRIGLVGAGKWGKRYIDTLARIDGVELAHVGSANPDSARLVPAGCRISPDRRAVIEDRSLHGIVLASPPATHCELALAAIGAGTPVLIEKPLTLGSVDARSLAAAAAAQGVLTMTGHTHIFSTAFRALKAQGAALGTLLRTRSRGGNRGPVRPDATVLWDWGPHDVAMCFDLFDSAADAIRAWRVATQQLPDGIGEAIAIDLEFASGGRSEILVSNIEPSKRRIFEAFFERGTLAYDDLAEQKLVRRGVAAEVEEAIAVDPSLPLDNLVKEFCTCVAERRSSHPSLDLGVRVVEVLEECQAQLERAPAQVP